GKGVLSLGITFLKQGARTMLVDNKG
ncbi:hypothetical protein CGSSp23BS72_07356, partial [Streptococcus pneumoniae SP23-BS72]